ncbi:MAG TPA: Omp28-related outer membrane protein [Bacteroidales bacterium]|nr:Omp28-related outer membrane protein [Bacteroidales bacterium]
MTRKFFFTIVLAFAIGSFGWMSCEKIDEPIKVVDHKIYPENPDDTLFFKDSISTTLRQVLLEEFTGHRCVNCPEASLMVHQLAASLDHRLIIYNVHSGNFAEPQLNTCFNTDFRSTVGNKLNLDFGIWAYPSAMIDRVKKQGMYTILKGDWEGMVTDELAKPNVANLKLVSTWFPKLSTVTIAVETEFLVETVGEYRLAVYLVEDSIISPQLNNKPQIGADTLMNYVHHNVLRDAINGTYGEYVTESTGLVSGEIYTKRYNYTVNPDWNIEHCNLIAYLGKYDATYNLIEIIQVVELAVKTE